MFSARREESNPPRGVGMGVGMDVGMDMGMDMGGWHTDGGNRLQESQLAMAGGDSE